MRNQIFLIAVGSILLTLGGVACNKKGESASESIASKSSVAESEAKDSAEFLDNQAYRFHLRRPNADWKLQDRKEIQNLIPGAQAGLNHRKGLVGVVLIERSSGMSLAAMADLIIGSMPLENREVTLQEEVEFVGLPAIHYELSGSINDVRLIYSVKIFLRGDYAYQLTAFAVPNAATPGEREEFFASFSLTEGKIDPTVDAIAQIDTLGVGWQLKDGTFSSAISGLRVTPTGNWHAVVGAEARRVNPEAEVVLMCEDPEAYFIVVPERIGAADPDAYRKDRVEQTLATMSGKVAQENYSHEFLGKPLAMTSMLGDGAPWTFHLGVSFNDDWAFQAIGWYNAAYGESGKTAVFDALGSIHRMNDEEVESLRRELHALPDPQNQIGGDYSVRGGVFSDYANGVRWSKPKLGFWELSAGQEARAVNPIAQLYGRYQNSAAHILLVAETLVPGTSAAQYHRAAYSGLQANLSLQTSRAAAPSRIASGAALTSEATTASASIALFYRVTTAVQGVRGVQLHVWGPAAGMVEHAEALAAVPQNLEILPSLPTTSHEAGRFSDHRLGYSLKLPLKYRLLEATPAEIAGIGSFATWGVDGKDWVGVLALGIIEEGQDHEWSMDFMQGRIEDSYASLLSGLKPTKSDAKIAGVDARHLVWKRTGLRMDGYLFRNGKTIYALIATDDDQGTDMLEQAVAGFQFL